MPLVDVAHKCFFDDRTAKHFTYLIRRNGTLTNYKITFALSVILAAANGLSARCAEFPDGTAPEKQELLEAFETSILVTSQGGPLDCRGETYISEKFHDHVAANIVMRFRLQYDRGNQKLRWASETRPLPSDKNPNPNGASFHFCVVDGVALETGNGVSESRRETFQNFGEAIVKCAVPVPDYWGIHLFPFVADGKSEMDDVKKIVLEPGATVSSEQQGNELLFKVNREVPPGSNDVPQILEWRFRLPDMIASGHRFCRINDGKTVQYYRQSIEFIKKKGTALPFIILGESLIVGEDLQGVFRAGKKEITTQLEWLVPSETGPTTQLEVKERIRDAVSIQKFIDAATTN